MSDNTKISSGDLRYICSRNRQQAYNVVIREMKKSGLKQVQLAHKIGKTEDVVSRLLKAPQNWQLDTFSELMYGTCGGALKFLTDYPNQTASTTSSGTNVVQPKMVVKEGSTTALEVDLKFPELQVA